MALEGYVKIGQTTEGKYYGQVKHFNGATTDTHYETPEYTTKRMAQADAECWKAFHMTPEVNTVDIPVQGFYSIDADDKVYHRGEGYWTGEEFMAKMGNVISHPDTTFQVTPFKGTTKGFHIRIQKGRTPARLFRVVKAGN
jgi:hypothetical protein